MKDLRPLLLEERIPDGWQPRVRSAWGLTFCGLQSTVLPVELGVQEEIRGALAKLGMGGRDE